MRKSIILMAASLACFGCKTSERPAVSDLTPVEGKPILAIQPKATAAVLPKAVIYRTDGDYAHHVAITLNTTRTAVTAYPAVSDVSADSAPIAIADGWLLDRRGGISSLTAFLTWTYEEYAALPATPTVAELMAHILPDARVTEVRRLAITQSEALAHPEAIQP